MTRDFTVDLQTSNVSNALFSLDKLQVYLQAVETSKREYFVYSLLPSQSKLQGVDLVKTRSKGIPFLIGR